MKQIGLIDVDGHNFPNFALMKISAWHKAQGDAVEWALPRELFECKEYDIIYASKIFTFSPDFDARQYLFKKMIKGGTGYDIKSTLPDPIEKINERARPTPRKGFERLKNYAFCASVSRFQE